MIRSPYSVKLFDITIASIIIIILLPIIITNVIIALIHQGNILRKTQLKDDVNREFILYTFNYGYIKKSAHIFNIYSKNFSFCGVGYKNTKKTNIETNLPTGIFSIYELHKLTGLSELTPKQCIELHQQKSSIIFNFLIMIKTVIAKLLYGNDHYSSPSQFYIFGLKINNIKMTEAIQWATKKHDHCQIGVFVNVNSVNLCFKQKSLGSFINQADRIMADGSGIRIAAKKLHIKLKDNVNGTDMLPLLCEQLYTKQKSVYLYGAKPGVAEQCAVNLSHLFPQLRIAGVTHGYIENQSKLIETINRSGADVLLVALGSPYQEQWLVEHKHQLKCSTALAVGGLFDFYSGRIPRAPRWLRELGCEWVYRLMQEPKSKFNRYVIGNPIFLWRINIHKKTMGKDII